MVDNENAWIEKYRVYKLDEILYQDTTLFKSIVKNKNMPNILLWGSCGIGKTSAIVSLCLELYGAKRYSENVLEINASMDTGINVIRKIIITFTKTKMNRPHNNYPSFKTIICDEADRMTSDSMSALRKVMEESLNTRFVFICNDVSRIIEPIQSRCIKIKFREILPNIIFNKLKQISIDEKLHIDDDSLLLLSNLSNGDFRKSILFLQNLKFIDTVITKNDIYNICKYITFDEFSNIVNNLHNIDDVINSIHFVLGNGYTINSILEQSMIFIINYNTDDYNKSTLLFDFGIIEKNIYDSCNEFLQLLKIFNDLLNFIHNC